MRLRRFQLSGFKSFARTTALEFSHPITAIVGPNGSGKSNIAEGIRWVLGEQSIKILRGKKGEDLIFNGSQEISRMGKASVTLVFDNRDGKIPLDFQDVVFERKIFRDGTNEYYLNNSQVRLKDIVELLARIGLGETKHNIIGQGEVDRILLSSPKDRREMLEEAIGLRVYQLKKAEAERKLGETSKNTSQAHAILKEIAPHLRFLRAQAEKAENRDALERQLREAEIAWIVKNRADITTSLLHLKEEHGPEEIRLAAIEAEIEEREKEIAALESRTPAPSNTDTVSKTIHAAETERQTLLLALGRIEGKLESHAPNTPERAKTIDAALVRRHLGTFLDRLEEIQPIDDMDEVRERITALISDVEVFLGEVERETRAPARAGAGSEDRARLEEMRRGTEEKLSHIQETLARMREDADRATEEFRKNQVAIRQRERTLREKEEERNGIRTALQRSLFERERLAEREREVEEEMDRLGVSASSLDAFDDKPFSSLSADDMKRKMEKFRVRLEEIGGIDHSVVREYEDTKTRYEFIEKEMRDLEAASRDLRLLVKELEDTMERDFHSGFAKIKEEFNTYFRIIFGGGKGTLTYAPIHTHMTDSETGEEYGEAEKKEYGVEIDVDVPRKRVRGLAMLSGGERALTSIALLFAITAVNPPPFLVLDETDAALDEANSQKYAAILRELSKKTQLIIITHNRETMKQAGVLYGVTMGGDGASKLLSLQLEEAAAYTNR